MLIIEAFVAGAITYTYYATDVDQSMAEIGANYGLTDPLLVLFSNAPLALGLLVTGIALSTGAWPAVRDIHGYEASARPVVVGLMIVGVVVLVLVAATYSVVTASDAISTTTAAVLGVPVLLVVGYPLIPRLRTRGWELRSPTDAERDVVEAARERAGVAVDEIAIAGADQHRGAVWILGVVGRSRLIVEESFLEGATREDLAVAIAEADGRYRHRIFGRMWAVVSLAIWYVTIGVLEPWGATQTELVYFGVVVFTAIFGLMWSVRKRMFEIDDRVCDQFPDEDVADTYDRQPEIHFVAGTEFTPLRYLLLLPSIEHRVDRLRGNSDDA
ncbi:hypothetical protein [Natronoarchaeum philippinense]|uniref:hypothetical protein n=1 Tax=Natronoarchaeum philippinense TaxID=558529 RepID=UPI00117E7B55|nr:hypothetical protein [Natronoarchaeum philippinense]